MQSIGDRKTGAIFPYDPRSVSASFTRIYKQYRIEDLRFHDLRHGAIGKIFTIGFRIEQVAMISGHKDWAMLRRYKHIKAKDVHKAFKDLLGAQDLKVEVMSD